MNISEISTQKESKLNAADVVELLNEDKIAILRNETSIQGQKELNANIAQKTQIPISWGQA